MIKTHYNIPKGNQFLIVFDNGMNLNRNSFWNRFEHFQEESKSPLVRNNNEELHIFIKFKEYQINRKIGALRKKRQTDFLELNFSN